MEVKGLANKKASMEYTIVRCGCGNPDSHNFGGKICPNPSSVEVVQINDVAQVGNLLEFRLSDGNVMRGEINANTGGI